MSRGGGPIIDLGVGDTLLRALALGQQAANARANQALNERQFDLAGREFDNRVVQQGIDNQQAESRLRLAQDAEQFNQQQWAEGAPNRAMDLDLGALRMSQYADEQAARAAEQQQRSALAELAATQGGMGPPNPTTLAMVQGLPAQMQQAMAMQQINAGARSRLLQSAMGDVQRLRAGAMANGIPVDQQPMAIYNTLGHYPEDVRSEAIMSEYGIALGTAMMGKTKAGGFTDQEIDDIVGTGALTPEYGEQLKALGGDKVAARELMRRTIADMRPEKFDPQMDPDIQAAEADRTATLRAYKAAMTRGDPEDVVKVARDAHQKAVRESATIQARKSAIHDAEQAQKTDPSLSAKAKTIESTVAELLKQNVPPDEIKRRIKQQFGE